ncbi:MAG TPA: N-acetylmuramoyl-L-alanine amidase [Actinomycetota bacterium]
MELIRHGDRGDRVADVQTRLAALGYGIPASERDGRFGDGTKDAVVVFQRGRGIRVDGIVGPETWHELVDASWKLGDRVLYLRSPNLRGDDVRDLQDRLTTLGFDVWRTDGIFGPRTAGGVKDFQRNYGLPDDGIVADTTFRALLSLPRMTGDTPSTLVREREELRDRPGAVTGMKIVLDPAHGGDDAGATGPGGVREADLCFHLVRKVEALLAASGAHVYLTRPTHDAPEDSERAALANILEADLYLALHTGGHDEIASDRPPKGAAAYFFGHERYRSETGAHLAALLLDELGRLGLADAGVHARTFRVLRETRMTAVLLETGVLADPDDEHRLTDLSFQDRLARAVAEAVLRFAREPVTG